MRTILICFVLISTTVHIFSAVEPYIKSQVPWAVYLPEDDSDTAGNTDPSKFLYGDAIAGWHTYLVFKKDGTHIKNNSDLYSAGAPIINKKDNYDELTLTADPDYIICKFILIQPATSPSVGIDGIPDATLDSSSIVDFTTKEIDLGNDAFSLGYNINERKIENINISNDYWLAAVETQKQLWRIIYGDKLFTASANTLAVDTINVFSNTNDVNVTIALTTTVDNFVIALPAANPAEFVIKHELPIICMNWLECQEFNENLSEKLFGTNIKDKVRVPNEYEWEYAARAGESAALPTELFDPDQSSGWKIIKPSDLSQSPLPVQAVFEKMNHPVNIPHRVAGIVQELVEVGSDTNGDPIWEMKNKTLKWVIDPRMNTLINWQLIIGGGLNYDKRYPANFTALSSRNFEIQGDDSFLSKKLTEELFLPPDPQAGQKNGVVKIEPLPNAELKEYYENEESLARAVNNYYMGVKEDGSYAARLSDPVNNTSTTYVYDPKLVHHFVKLTGESVLPPSHPISSIISTNNSVLTYLHWHSFNPDANYLGSLYNETKVYENAKEELTAQIFSHSYENNPGDYEELNWKGSGEVYIPKSSTINEDIDIKAKNTSNSMLSIDIANRHRDDTGHSDYYISTWTSSGSAMTESQSLPADTPVIPIDNMNILESHREISMGTNEWGFEAMLGNAAELCMPAGETDWASRWNGASNYEFYSNNGSFVVARGGGWDSNINGIRYSNRKAVSTINRSPAIGFRILIEQ
ncbi:MAG: SUMF1/EgtB/PvdO family nonheme iron enzyme [Planctomycetes bacterium]|nr:SUMF1/EgtB/PvdO family nonheme iron enzyme [Planctomycetota bacterium]